MDYQVQAWGKWLDREGVGIYCNGDWFISSAPESEKLAKLADSDNEVSIIPSFTGLGAPYWKPDLKAAIHGLSLEI